MYFNLSKQKIPLEKNNPFFIQCITNKKESNFINYFTDGLIDKDINVFMLVYSIDSCIQLSHYNINSLQFLFHQNNTLSTTTDNQQNISNLFTTHNQDVLELSKYTEIENKNLILKPYFLEQLFLKKNILGFVFPHIPSYFISYFIDMKRIYEVHDFLINLVINSIIYFSKKDAKPTVILMENPISVINKLNQDEISFIKKIRDANISFIDISSYKQHENEHLYEEYSDTKTEHLYLIKKQTNTNQNFIKNISFSSIKESIASLSYDSNYILMHKNNKYTFKEPKGKKSIPKWKLQKIHISNQEECLKMILNEEIPNPKLKRNEFTL